MAESQLGQLLAAAVQSPLAEVAAYLALITQTNPAGSADALLGRPDVDAMLREALSEARVNAEAFVEQAWLMSGAPDSALFTRLMADVARQFSSLAHLRGLIRHAHASVPRREFEPGTDKPGSHPSREAAELRAGAVSRAVLGWGRQVATRARMTLSSAEGYGTTEAVLEDAYEREAAGEKLRKRWRRNPHSNSCLWCRRLDGVTIALRASFAAYLGGPAVLSTPGTRHVATPAGSARYHLPAGAPIIYTHPPRLYHGELQGPLLHPFCLPTGSVVAAEGVMGATSRIYHGELVSIRTLSDKLLSATPNHPVLTDHGWVPAGLVQEGDHVVSASGEEWPAFGDHHDEDVPATIEKVAEAFLGSVTVASAEVPVSAEDFHGDGAGSEVCVVGTDRGLLAEQDAVPAQRVSQHRFQRADAYLRCLLRLRHPAPGLQALRLAAEGLVRCCGNLLALLRGELAHAEGAGRTAPPWLDACAEQAVADDPAGDAERLCQGLLALPGGVTLDKVVHVERDVVTTHVYNLETASGWYIGNGIVVHNCECQLEIVRLAGAPVVPSGDGPAPRMPGGFLAASDVRAMTDDQYEADMALLVAAAGELDRVLERLAEGR